MASELAPPFSQCRLANVEPHALVAHRLHDHVHVRVRLVGMQRHYVPVFECEFLTGEVLHGCKYSLWGRAGRHRKHEFVTQLWGRPTARLGELGFPTMS